MVGSLKVRKGAWSEEEDRLLRKCIEKYGQGKWHQVPLRAGLNRCRKSCRLRWLNYLRPDIKRGEFEPDEIDLLTRLHKLPGNRWSLIAGRLPGRTANDVKNYWNTHLGKKIGVAGLSVREVAISDDDDQNASCIKESKIVKPKPRTFYKKSDEDCRQETSLVLTASSGSHVHVNRIQNGMCSIINSQEQLGFLTNSPHDQDGMYWWENLINFEDEISLWTHHGRSCWEEDKRELDRLWSDHDDVPPLG